MGDLLAIVWVRWLLILVILYAGWCGVFLRLGDNLVFPGSFGGGGSPPAGVEEWTLDIGANRPVPAWYQPSTEPGPRPAVVFFHGNGERIDQQYGILAGYRDLGCAVLLVEYRGYGQAGGEPTQRDIVKDSVAFVDRLARTSGVDPRRIVLHGRSLGGGVAAAVAAERPPAGLILESTFTSIAAFAKQLAIPPFLVPHPFRTDRVVGRLDGPILILHGRADRIVPFEHARRLRELAPGARLVEFDAGHNDLPSDSDVERYWAEIAAVVTGPPDPTSAPR